MKNLETSLWSLIVGEQTAPVADWLALLRLAESHGVAPLLYSIIKKLDLPAPGAANQAFVKSYYLSAARSQVLKVELDRLIEAFTQAGLPYLPLKGAALAWTVYPDPALRPMYDLDLLVQPGDLLKALQAAQKLGYRLDKLTYHAVLRGGPNFSISLELHWCLPGGQPLPPTFFISNNLQSKYFEMFTYIYCAAHLLRQHAANPRLIWRYDLRLLKDRIQDRAMLYRLAGQLDLLAELEVFENDTELQKFSTRSKIFEDTQKSVRLLPGSTRLRLAGALLFPSKEYMLWRYQPQPEWLWPAWYGSRMMQILKESQAQSG